MGGEDDLKGEEETRLPWRTWVKEEEVRRGAASASASFDARLVRKFGREGLKAPEEAAVVVVVGMKEMLLSEEVCEWPRTGRKGTEGDVERDRVRVDCLLSSCSCLGCCRCSSPNSCESLRGMKFSLIGPSSSPLTLREPDVLRCRFAPLLAEAAVGILDDE